MIWCKLLVIQVLFFVIPYPRPLPPPPTTTSLIQYWTCLMVLCVCQTNGDGRDLGRDGESLWGEEAGPRWLWSPENHRPGGLWQGGTSDQLFFLFFLNLPALHLWYCDSHWVTLSAMFITGVKLGWGGGWEHGVTVREQCTSSRWVQRS